MEECAPVEGAERDRFEVLLRYQLQLVHAGEEGHEARLVAGAVIDAAHVTVRRQEGFGTGILDKRAGGAQ